MPSLSRIDDSDLLTLRFRDLPLTAFPPPLQRAIDDLYGTLARRGIDFRPHCWISTDWFSPDGTPGIAIPFYLIHPRLMRLERSIRGNAEGGNARSRRMILRHEAGHAIDTAYRLRRRADWRQVFGRASLPYPSVYRARPASQRFVAHLDHWYAQSHPTEDFAETFAVWLQPRQTWRRQYAGWPALQKLEYVDSLMREISRQRPSNRDRSCVLPLRNNRRTLREHYRPSAPAAECSENRYDAWLRRTFTTRFRPARTMAAGKYLRLRSGEIEHRVQRSMPGSAYICRQACDVLRRRARELDLVLRSGQREALAPAARLLERVIHDILSRNSEQFRL